jgi:hypothetical protein
MRSTYIDEALATLALQKPGVDQALSALARRGDAGDTNIVTHLIDTAHALLSPPTYMFKSAADGLEAAMEAGTREVTQGIGAAIVVVSDRAADGVAAAIVESSRVITLAVVWAIAVLAATVLAHHVHQLRARIAALARLADANAELADASNTATLEMVRRRESLAARLAAKETDLGIEDGMKALVEAASAVASAEEDGERCVWADLTQQAVVYEMLLLHELLDVADAHAYRERKAAVKRLMAREGVDAGRLDELYARVRTAADIAVLRREMTPPEPDALQPFSDDV